MKRASAAALALLALSACSIFNAPDRSKIPLDGGMRDGAIRDGHLADREVPDGDICEMDVESNCTNGEDEDCDSLIDCADFDCAAATDCCDPGMPDERQWSATELMEWAQRPGGSVTYMAGIIQSFVGSVAMVRRVCEPLAAGRRLTFSFLPGAATCDGAPTDCFARVLLTPAASAGTAGSIVDQLAISLDGLGELRVTRAGAELATRTLSRDPHAIRIEVGSGVDELSQSVLVARVIVDDEETDPVLDGFAFVQQSFLRRAPDCEDVPGLRLGVEGRGSMVWLGPLTLTNFECVNPSQFRSPTVDGATLSHAPGGGSVSLDWGDWAQGGIAAPALICDADDWHVLADGSDFDRSLDPVVRELGYAVGHARAGRGEWDTTENWVAIAGSPRFGNCNPTCLGPDPGCTPACSGGVLDGSLREPTAFVDGAELVVAYAKRRTSPVHGLFVARVTQNPTGPGASAGLNIEPEAPCVSLRDPALARVDPGSSDAWLFYTCEQAAGVTEIHVRRVVTMDPMSAGTPQVVLTAVALGVDRVWSPEIVVDYVGSGLVDAHHVFRLWFLTKRAGASSPELSLAQGQVDGNSDVVPTLTPYAANPVFGIEHPMFQACRPDCVFLGATAARIPGQPYIRFLVARSMNAGAENDYQLAPLEQFWTLP